jgi:enoyl-CoA hydratase
MSSINLVSLEIHGHKAVLQINRSDALNALNKQVLLEINQHCQNLQKLSQIQVVLVCGAGDKSFVAGADIKELQNLSACEATKFSELGSATFSLLENLPQIVIAKVQGFALGGGLELALACDMIIASEKARFGFPEVTLGFIPGFAGTQRLSRKIGVSKAIEWITSAERYSAEQAYAHGLLNHIVKHEELNSFTESLADKIILNAPHAVRLAKHVIREGASCDFHAGCAVESANFGICFASDEAKEGVSAFIEKRKPQFKF